MSISESILFPSGTRQTDRKYYEAGARGRFEANLRIERGSIDTTTPTILGGSGFTVVRNGVGDITITFDPPFSATPSIVAIAYDAAGGRIPIGLSRTVSSVRLQRFWIGTGNAD